MTLKRSRTNGSELRVLLEVNSADLRIGAVNDALDLAELARPFGTRLVLCGPLTAAFVAEASRRHIEAVPGTSETFSRRGIFVYAASVATWLARLARLRPHVVHLNYAGYGPSLACASRLLGLPVVARAGGPFIQRNPLNRWASAYVANCPAHAEQLLASPLKERVRVTGDLFRPERVHSTMTLEHTLAAKRTGVARIVFLGQLVERKGLHILIDAFAQLSSGSELVLVGGDWSTGEYAQQLKAKIRDLGVESRVVLENHRQDVGAVLSSADILVLPSFSEARPRCIIEAMSLGVPVVATAVGGIPSLVIDEETGLLVPPGDVTRLAAALNRLIGSPSLRARFGAAARANVVRQCQPDRTAEEYVRLYQRVAGMTADQPSLPGV